MADISKEMAVQLAREAGFAYSWSEAAGEALERLIQAAFKLGRNAGLEEAKQLFPQPHQEYFGREAQDAIESLKDNTP